MRGWQVQVTYDDGGFDVVETKYIFLPALEDRHLAPLYYERFDGEFAAVEKKIRRVLARKNEVRIFIEQIDESYHSDNSIIKLFIAGDEVRVVKNGMEREDIPFDEAKKSLQKTLIRLKKQAKDACWQVATA